MCVAQKSVGSSGIGYMVKATRPSAYSTATYAENALVKLSRWLRW